MASQSLLAVTAKSTKPVDFQDKFLRFIEQNYDEKPSSFLDAIKELNGLRDASVVKTPDRHETGLDLIVRYYEQLCAVENKLPISESQARIKFTWSDAFQTGLLGGSKSASLVSGQYERCCVLFNVASLQSQIAKFQNFDSDEGLKNAAKHFQGAAGSFQLLREQVFSHLQTAPTGDLSAECTTALSTLMLAQAQESFVIKACKGKIKCQVIAKLAMQCADLYAEAHSNMQVGSVRGFWDRGWLPTVAAKSSYFHAVAQHQLGIAAQAQKSFGEAVARMKRGVELVTEAEKRGEGYFKPHDVTATLKRDFESANKDNNFIYNERIPDFGTLEPPGKAAVAKVVQFQFPSTNFVDLFAHLVPLPVSQALQTYNAKKDSLVQEELEKIRQATSSLNELLSDKNLPAAIEDISGNQVPDSIKEKSEQIRSQGGLEAIQHKIYDLPELLDRNREIVRETGRMLDEEEREDTAMKERFVSKWNRTASNNLTESLRGEVAKFQQIIDNATKADMTIRQKFDTHQNAIATLGKEEQNLEASLPKAGAQAALLSGSSAVQELRQLMEDVGTLKVEREVIEKELKNPITDIAPKFLQALKELGDVDEEAISEAHLQGEFGKLQQQVTESIQQQDQLVARINAAHEKFQQETQQHGSSARDTVLKELAAGFDTYQELMGNLQEGTQFYNNLTQLLVKLQGKVSDFVFARNTEKDDLLKDLQKTIASSPAQPPPATPQYQQPKTQAKQPPARPPPPAQQQPSSAPNPSAQSYQPPPPQAMPPQGYAPPYGYGAPPQPYYQQPPPPQGGYAPPPHNPYAPPSGYAPPPHGYAPPPQGYPGYQPPPSQPYGYYPPQPQGAYGQPYQPPPRR